MLFAELIADLLLLSKQASFFLFTLIFSVTFVLCDVGHFVVAQSHSIDVSVLSKTMNVHIGTVNNNTPSVVVKPHGPQQPHEGEDSEVQGSCRAQRDKRFELGGRTAVCLEAEHDELVEIRLQRQLAALGEPALTVY